MTHQLREATFFHSAYNLQQLAPDIGAEVAFAGRSNSGKSSAINIITDVRSLARTSKTPGRTQLIFFFGLPEDKRLVDLPGYGYAKVPAKIKAHWQQTLPKYLSDRDSLKGLVLMMDARHPLKQLDLDMATWCQNASIPVHILLTKSDKLSRSQSQQTLAKVIKHFKGSEVTVQLFSSLKHTGVDDARVKLMQWLYEKASDISDQVKKAPE